MVNIKEWITSIFPVMTLPLSEKSSSKRTAVVQLISLGKMSREALREVARGDLSSDDKLVLQVSLVMLGAYEGVMASEYDISQSELLTPDEVKQLAKELVEKTL